MSITTTYTCDRCGHAQNTPDQMWSIAVTIWLDHYRPPNLTYDSGIGKRGLWCRKCCESQGLLGLFSNPKADTEPTKEATLEDLLREIIRDEITAATGAV